MPSILQLVKQVLPSGSKVLSGETGLFNEISWVIVVRPTPPGFDGLKGNELAIIGSNTASGLGVSLIYLISTLIERKVGAIGIIGEVNAEVRHEAQIKGIPLIQLPPQANINSLETQLTHFISEEKQFLYQKEREFNHSLMELAVAGVGADVILKKLEDLTGRRIGFIDLNLKPHFSLDPDLASVFPKAVQQGLLKLHYLSKSNGIPVVGMSLTSKQASFLGPIRVARETKGYLMLLVPEEEVSEVDRLAIMAGSLALAVEMSRRQAIEETTGRFEEDMVEILTSGDYSIQIVNERAKKFDLDLSLLYVVMVIRPTNPLSGETVLKNIVSWLPKTLAGFRDEKLVILNPLKSTMTAVELKNLGKKFAENLTRNIGTMITMGIGRPYSGSPGIRLSFQEAEQALNMGIKLFGAGSITNFGDLGIYRLLFNLKTSSELKSFYNEYLGKLDEYEAKHDGGLQQTLNAYLQYGTAAETARILHVHRNTLLYRLGRIQEITGYDLEDSETRLALHLAFMVGEVIHTN